MRKLRMTAGTTALVIFATLGILPSVARGADAVVTIKFTVIYTSIATTLHTLPDGHVYGWNHYAGTTQWAGQETGVDFLGAVNYVNGTGRFEGFVTLTRADGVILAFRVEGNALLTDILEESHTEFSAAGDAPSTDAQDGARPDLRATGDALSTDGREEPLTRFSGRLEVIQGTGDFEGATGIGVTKGFRKSTLGSPATFSYILTVARN